MQNHKKNCARSGTLLRDERGFISVETIITIMVIAGILASVFAGAAMMMEKSRQSKAWGQIATITQNFRSLYCGQEGTGTGNLTQTAIQAGVFPSDMKMKNGVFNPWNGAVTLEGAGMDFTLSLEGLPDGSCMDMVTKQSASGQDLGLQEITVNGKGLNTFPVTPENASTSCKAGTNTVQWRFRMRG